MFDNSQIKKIQDSIGYTFRDISLLTTVFMHPSAANKGMTSNALLGFIGKPVCELLIRDYLYSNHLLDGADPHTAETKISPLIKQCCDGLMLAKYLVLSTSAEALRYSKVVENELFIALVGAIYKDSGMPAVRAFVIPRLKNIINNEAPELLKLSRRQERKNPITIDRDPFSDDYTASTAPTAKSPAKAAAKVIKNLFSSKKRIASDKNDSTTHMTTSLDKEETKAVEKRTVNTQKASESPKPSKLESVNQKPIATDGNYKSALQEYVQKNIRSSTVKLIYKDTKDSSGYTTSIYLFDKKIAEATGSTKKSSSQNAARLAYEGILSANSEANKWFNKLKADPQSTAHSEKEEAADYVSRLNHTYQKLHHRSDASLKYERINASSKNLIATVIIADGKRLATGEGKNAKEAKQNAAKAALSKLSATK